MNALTEIAGCHRGVLTGAFEILDVLGHADAGLGLTDLAHQTGLAKSTVHRLAEQLVSVDAVQRIGQRYFIGPAVARLGRCWQPDPQLRQAAYAWVRTLAALAQTAAAVYVLCEGRGHLVTATVGRSQSWLPPVDLDAVRLPRTAIGRALLACYDTDGPGFPACRWRRPSDLPGWREVVADDRGATGGFGWIAAPVRRSDGLPAAAVGAIVVEAVVPPRLKDAVISAAEQIGRACDGAPVR
ncbi:helix-turn-helix domain-containing protein [Mycobacterium sp. M1]|uniref:Helix-turn-helix domain-containing protein n=1 Tax=Mycolicibacter acidiphilus TaxID=2835306 RepID=A0ABS5RM89_9MYCO|nr:helix-turn-helix domain-containing protein [Mycolicibacter acidiphilus]MBS9535427.1 helix-turn-helix domain-containing protein [Mycolicibacter acidiphilus]